MRDHHVGLCQEAGDCDRRSKQTHAKRARKHHRIGARPYANHHRVSVDAGNCFDEGGRVDQFCTNVRQQPSLRRTPRVLLSSERRNGQWADEPPRYVLGTVVVVELWD